MQEALKKEFISKSVEDTSRFAQLIFERISPRIDGALVIALSGDLGAGKTAFTKELAHYFGVDSSEVTSPTFVIEKIYAVSQKGFSRLIHIDAYRLDSGDELLKLGWKEIVEDKENIIVIEWPEKVADIIPSYAVAILIEHAGESERIFTVKKI